MTIIRLIIIGVVTLLACKFTTFGWQFSPRQAGKGPPKDKALPERIKAHVVMLSDRIGDRSVFQYEKIIEAQKYISSELALLGYKIELQEFHSQGKAVSNIIASKPGKAKPEEIIIVGAHYDTCFNPGANDNASAVAVLLELARACANQDYDKTIKFIAFVNEEPPFYKTEEMGSLVYARQAKKENKNIKIAVILETIGSYCDKPFSQRYPLFLGPFYPNKGNFIAVVGNFTVRQSVNTVTRLLRKYCPFSVRSIALFNFIEGVDFSDHWSFWQMGFAAVMLTDTAFYRYHHYHKNSDTFEKLDYDNLALLTEALEGVLRDDL